MQDGNRLTILNPYIAERTDISHAALRLYVIMAGYTGRGDVCWPSVALLAEKFHTNERNIRVLLGQLVAHGVIRREQRFREDGSQSSNRYVLIDLTPEARDDGKSHAGAVSSLQGGVSLADRGGCKPLTGGAVSQRQPLKETLTSYLESKTPTSDVESPKNLTPTTEILDPSAESCTRGRAREAGREAVALNGHHSPRKGRALALELQVIERVEACDPKQRYLVPRWFDEWGPEVVAEAHREAKRHCAKSYVVGMLKEFAHRPAWNGFYDVEKYRALNIQHHDLIGTPM